MLRLRSLLAVLFTSLIFVSVSHAQEKVELRLRGTVGERCLVTAAFDDRFTESYGDEKTQTRLQFRIVAETEIIAPRRDGALRMKITYRQMAVTDNGNGLIERYDSQRDAKSTSLMAKIFNAMIGQSLTAVVNAKGKVLDVEGAKEFKNRLIMAMKLPIAEQNQVKEMLKDSLSSERMASAVGAILLPEKSVAFGESWQRKLTRKDDEFSVQVAQTSTLKAVVNNVVTVEVREKIYADPNTKVIRTKDGEFKYLMNGSGTSSVQLDATSGQFLAIVSEQRLSGKLLVTLKTKGSEKATSDPISFPVYSKKTMQGWGKKLPRGEN